MMEKKKKKVYESTKVYNEKYNKQNLNVSLDRELLNRLKEHLDGKPMKSYIENLIEKSLEEEVGLDPKSN